jgi:hypothetical protein
VRTIRVSAPVPRPATSRPASAGSTGSRPQIEVRPEVSYYKSLDAFAFNGNPNLGIPANRNYAIIGAADIIIHL